jgi:uncharacterized protein involved in exopolysaccharide biosynthesis
VREAIASAERSPAVEETTGRNPTYDYLATELARSQSELAGLNARAAATARSLAEYRSQAWQIARVEAVEQTLLRDVKQLEQNYLIAARKREEARISDALDHQGIVNVAIAEKPNVPVDPAGPRRALIVLLGSLVGGFLSIAFACAAEFWPVSLRVPRRRESLNPVLATLRSRA